MQHNFESSNSVSNHTRDETNWTPPTQLSDYVQHVHMTEHRIALHSVLLKIIVNLHNNYRISRLQQISVVNCDYHSLLG